MGGKEVWRLRIMMGKKVLTDNFEYLFEFGDDDA